MWLAKVEANSDTKIDIDWQPFSLAQVNSDQDAELKTWELPGVLDGSDKTFLAHQSGLAAKRQGPDAFKSFLVALLKARHEEKKDLTDPEVMREAAEKAGLDVGRFLEDQADPDLLREIGESHTKAVEEHGVFGVPTYVVPRRQLRFPEDVYSSRRPGGGYFQLRQQGHGGVRARGRVEAPPASVAPRGS